LLEQQQQRQLEEELAAAQLPDNLTFISTPNDQVSYESEVDAAITTAGGY
jgi:hypothetical protein